MADFTYEFTDKLGRDRTFVTSQKLTTREKVLLRGVILASDAENIPTGVATLCINEVHGKFSNSIDFVGLTNLEVMSFISKVATVETNFDIWDGMGLAFAGKVKAGKVYTRSDWLWDGDLIRAQRERDADYADEVRANG